MKSAVLLLSSGLDSAANLVLSDGFQVKVALTIDYGQKGAIRELHHAHLLAKYFNIEHVSFDLGAFKKLTSAKSALFGTGDVPVPTSLDDLGVTTKSASAVWVPNRNGVLLSLAAALAESRGLQAVAVGFNAEEAVTFPDNTPVYMRAMTESWRYSTSNKVEVVSSTAELTKKQIVERLSAKGFPFELLWSCYQGGLQHCGRCESCQRLKRALEAGLSAESFRQVYPLVFGMGVDVDAKAPAGAKP